MNQKKRLDTYMAEHNMANSREKAKAIIMSGIVYVDNQKCDKAGTLVTEDSVVEVRGNTLKYVSRGGLKLEKALNVFRIDMSQRICMDIGASTGGFTDCMLQNGARKVYAVDVGYGQLAWSLRINEKVVNMERTNIRFVQKTDIGEPLDFVSVDVAFISLKLVLPVAFELLKEQGEVVALIKPQFEAGREKVGKKGVVRDKAVHLEVTERIYQMVQEMGFGVVGIDFSPIKGPEGNIEYLIYLKKNAQSIITMDLVRETVELSHRKWELL